MNAARRALQTLPLVGLVGALGCGPLVLLHERDPRTLRRIEVLGDRSSQWLSVEGVDGAHRRRILLPSVDALSGHVAYGFLAGGREPSDDSRDSAEFAVAHDDEVVQEHLDGLLRVLLSPDGKHVAYVALAKGGQVLGLDGVIGRAFTRIDPDSLTFTHDGLHAGAEAMDANGHYVVTDEREFGPYQGVERLLPAGRGLRFVRHGVGAAVESTNGSVAFDVGAVDGLCAAGSHVWFLGEVGGSRVAAHLDAADEALPEPRFALGRESDVEDLRCADDGTVAWTARAGHAVRVVVDGISRGSFEEAEPVVLRAGHAAFVAYDGRGYVVRYDGSEVAREPYATSPALSADGRTLAYAARREGRNGIVFGTRWVPSPRLVPDTLAVSDDGADFGVLVADGRGRFSVLGAHGSTRLPDGVMRSGPPRAAPVASDVDRLRLAVASIVRLRRVRTGD